ncbi:N-acyl homoserine lactonase family protein, partial [Staphylococcus aureus]|nr:N-acyl homoserine lactonase family protein [Staphylococcus aureus]
YLPHQWENIAIQTYPLKDNGIGPTGKSFDLFGDGTVDFIHTPGHSPGLCTTRVKAHKDDASYLLLASDVGYAEKSWKNGILPGLVV